MVHRVKYQSPAKRIVRTLAIASVALILMTSVSVGAIKSSLPAISKISDYKPPQSTHVYTDDGELAAVFAEERRTVIEIRSLPKFVVNAFLAAEDAKFYEHKGLDYTGIFRAVLKNLRPGAHRQGASTITQQTVKALITGDERTYGRKIREAMLAFELERLLSKDDILYIYLNQIYFGSGAYGIEEAAQTYFGKPAKRLSIAEAAILAGAPKNPSKYNIRSNPEAAKERRKYVLDQMQEHGWITQSEWNNALQASIPLPATTLAAIKLGPHYIHHVREQLVQRFGEKQVMEGGLTVYLGMNAEMQRAATRALQTELETFTKMHGWKGANARVEVNRWKTFYTELRTTYASAKLRRAHYVTGANGLWIWDLRAMLQSIKTGTPVDLMEMQLLPAKRQTRIVVPITQLRPSEGLAFADLGGSLSPLKLTDLKWARPLSVDSYTPEPRNISSVFHVGDLVEVEIINPNTNPIQIQLIPIPAVQAALVSIDPETYHVRALVGGYEQTPGGLNRATQALRQPGSAFKPILYAAAIAAGTITPASICPDSPVVRYDPWTGQSWKPENYEDGVYDGNITYRTALTRSKNTCSVKLIEQLGVAPVIDLAKRLGIASSLPANDTLALGTGDITPLELAGAYNAIAAKGAYATPIFIRKVEDARGIILLENKAQPEQILTPAAAYVVTSMMESVVESGTGKRAQALGRPIAAKTGTSNESRNLWFSGFTPDLEATVWIGLDDNKPVGRSTGSSAALPIWLAYMQEAVRGTTPTPFTPPLEGITMIPIDPITGDLVDIALPHRMEVFITGSEPTVNTKAPESIFLEDEP